MALLIPDNIIMVTNIMSKYVNSLVKNVNSENLPKDIDLIFDGGALNCLSGQGVALYIKELENQELVRIHRVSGCSSGAFIALLYLTNTDYDLNEGFNMVSNCFREKQNLTEFIDQVKKYIYNNLPDDLSFLNDKLYITYYDMSEWKQKIVCVFENKDKLIETIVRSCYIPYIFDKHLKYKDKYIDGITPYIFRDNKREAIFVMLVTKKNFSKCISTKNESNSYSRLLSGAADADLFFSGGSSDMCSYVSKWNIYFILILRLRELVFFIIVWIIELITKFSEYIPNQILNSTLYHGCCRFISNIYIDIVCKFLF